MIVQCETANESGVNSLLLIFHTSLEQMNFCILREKESK